MSPKADPRRGNRIAAVLMLLAASMASMAAAGTVPALFVALTLVFTLTAFAIAVRGQAAG